MVAVDDIGKFSAKAFTDADKFKGAGIDYAGDAVTMAEAAAALSELTGKTRHLSADPDRGGAPNSEDFAKMLEWFDAGGYTADIPSLESQLGHPSGDAQAVGSQPRRAERGAARRLGRDDRPRQIFVTARAPQRPRRRSRAAHNLLRGRDMRGMSRAVLVAIAIGALVDAAGCGGTSSSNDAAGGGSGGGGSGGGGGGSGGGSGGGGYGRGSGRDLSGGSAGCGRDLRRHADVLLRGLRRQRPHDRELCERRVERRHRSVRQHPASRRICQPGGEVCVIRAGGALLVECARGTRAAPRSVVRLPAIVLRRLHSWRVAGVRRYDSVQHVSVRPVPVTGGQS